MLNACEVFWQKWCINPNNMCIGDHKKPDTQSGCRQGSPIPAGVLMRLDALPARER